ncbi:hypothetical protein CK203_112016 [Vitis vinifera]|uniref:Uncharacterized protein n=1 Tax=Vitis vinifera TaxID=29760 RepID=A0A438CAD0_VITVI|nr:hypothetical protein CK203_112016 [Vitis vinifera]
MPTITYANFQQSGRKPKLTATLRSHFLVIPRPTATKKKKRPPHLTHISYGAHQRGHTNLSASHEARPSASAPQDSSQASQAPTVPSSEGEVPSSPP